MSERVPLSPDDPSIAHEMVGQYRRRSRYSPEEPPTRAPIPNVDTEVGAPSPYRRGRIEVGSPKREDVKEVVATRSVNVTDAFIGEVRLPNGDSATVIVGRDFVLIGARPNSAYLTAGAPQALKLTAVGEQNLTRFVDAIASEKGATERLEALLDVGLTSGPNQLAEVAPVHVEDKPVITTAHESVVVSTAPEIEGAVDVVPEGATETPLD